MPLCSTCRGPTVRGSNGLYTCPICGMTYKPGQSTPLLSKFAPKDQSALQTQGDKDLDLFIQKLTQKLLPIYKDYPPNVKQVSYANREKIKTAFFKVTEGKMSFKKWFDWIHTSLGKHQVDLANLMVQCCEGLQSEEAKEFRQGCQQFQQHIAGMYNAGSSGV